ncbi:SET domain-containing protein [Ferruginibacter albus]|uniref:SET domain-containing protein n=1 Tax=Ferruginibacter albus TaxID=2875540 RepID=UPI001CC7E8E0|nr:SET domain-containing protein [Ferruginibacter albus]UAY51367.1 SET domain-containing protein [Ferruginibacter albus]
MLKPYLFIDKTAKKGRGVFTKQRIAPGTVIEISPVIVMSKEDKAHIEKTVLFNYIFDWGKKGKCCMAIGLVPMYNHSYESNCEYIMDYTDDTITIQTVRAIKKGEELTINYNGDWKDATQIWFDAKQ